MYIYLYVDLNSVNLSHFLITKDRFFVVESSYGFDDVPTVKYTEDDYYETIERQCVETSDYLIAIFDSLMLAKSFCDMKRKEYHERLDENNSSEEYGYTRYNIFVFNESKECFEVL